MAIKTIKEESLTALGNAIRAKTGDEDLLEFPNGMIGAINSYNGKLPAVLDGTITVLTEADLNGATQLRAESMSSCSKLTDVFLPDTVTQIGNYCFQNCSKLANVRLSHNIRQIYSGAFSGCSALRTLRFESSIIPTIYSDSFPQTITFEVPGELYDTYLEKPYWGTVYKSNLLPYTEYAGKPISRIVLDYNNSKSIEIALQNYTTPPTVEAIVANPEIAEVMIHEINNENILFSIFSLSTEGSTTVELNITGKDDVVFTRVINVDVYAELAPSTYSVEIPTDVTYGFELNSNGYYESTNKGKHNTFAYCKVNISNQMGYPVYIDCISYGESSYDYGILSAVNKNLSKDASEGTYFYSFKGASKPTVQTVEYVDAVGDCYITIKYKKDTSTDTGNDTLQFKVRFGE